jgi:phosphoribosylformylglycinamidine synthase
MNCLSEASGKGLVKACHDCSDGGIGVAIAEMAFSGGLGTAIYLTLVPLGEPIDRDDFILFSESNSRFLVEVTLEDKAKFEEIMETTRMAIIGQVIDSEVLEVYGLDGSRVIAKPLNELKEAWQKPIRW